MSFLLLVFVRLYKVLIAISIKLFKQKKQQKILNYLRMKFFFQKYRHITYKFYIIKCLRTSKLEIE